MKIFGITINGNLIGQVLISIFIGWLIGFGISCINVFGYSGQAPLICAMTGGISAVGRLVRQNRKLTQDNNSQLLNTADFALDSLVEPESSVHLIKLSAASVSRKKMKYNQK